MENRAEAIKAIGGQDWEKYGKHRIYINDLPRWIGLECTYYNTGNISSATLDGERISNSQARRYMHTLDGKIWYDYADDQLHSRGIADDMAHEIFRAINKAIGQQKPGYDKSAIMRRAWEIRKNSIDDPGMSYALRHAWAEAKGRE